MSAEQLLSSGEFGTSIVVADLEAGIGTLSRLGDSQVDLTLVVVEPTPRSLDVGRRAIDLARENQQGRVVVVVNKVVDVDTDLALVREKLGDAELVVVPDDDAVLDADRAGTALLDHAPDCPAARALVELVDLVSDSAA